MESGLILPDLPIKTYSFPSDLIQMGHITAPAILVMVVVRMMPTGKLSGLM